MASLTLGLFLGFWGLAPAFAAPAPAPAAVQTPHGRFKEECALCHSANGWTRLKLSPRFDHGRYGMPLEGAHRTSDCKTCHTSLDFTNSRAQCVSCHQDPHRGEQGTDCGHCHNTRSFTDRGPMIRAHQLSSFPLTGNHALLDCNSCHKPAAQGQLQYSATPSQCSSCHMEAFRSTQTPDHVAAGFPTDCKTCHETQAWTTATFNHDKTAFPLTGSHRNAQCNQCHAFGTVRAISTACASCHAATYASASPPHSETAFPEAQCGTCHNTTAWTTGFDHSTTAFPLTGAHASRACADCHSDGVYAGKSVDCYSCHQNSTPGYANTTAPVHSPPAFGTSTAACKTCHTTTAWQPALFAHPATFALANGHANAACEDCHKGNYATLVNNCYSCHQNSTPGYATSTNPAHSPANFGTTNNACKACHNTTAWRPATFTHPATFPLTNAHQNRQCDDCHAGNYATLANNCFSCHQNSTPGYAAATNPPHTPTNFPTTNAACTGCHSTVAFQPSAWPANHSTTAFAAKFTGAHASLACTDCHNAATWNVQGTGNNCYGCHAADYAGTTNPKHDTTNFPTAGCTCHTLTAWTGATSFDHTAAGFPLTGNHSTTVRQCTDCHNTATGGYTNTSTACITCHQTSTPGYNNPGTSGVVHNAQYFPTAQCATCHTAANSGHVTWAGGTLSHPATFPLSNAHAARQCQDCHAGNYATLVNNCYSCHQNSVPGYATATNPTHTPANFPTTNTACTGCHTTIAFSPSTWPANHSTTAFAANFKGAHTSLACTDCHNVATWSVQGTGSNCYGCHAADYAATTSPHHDTVNYPTAGCTCHTTTTWTGANAFDHTAAGFPLTGNHSTTVRQCTDCHNTATGGYTNTSTACITCHQTSTPGYNNPGTSGVVHNAQYFPTAQCATCHTAANSGHVTWAGGTLTHPATFPLTNSHAARQCQDCHAGNYTAVANTCYSCHQNSVPGYANATNPPHSPTNFPTTNTACTGCHNTVAFQPSTWPANHSTTAFAATFTGAHLALACTDCHNAATWSVQGTGNNCYGCHAADYAGTTNPKHDTVNYPTAGCSCHTTITWTGANAFDHTSVGFPLTGNHSTAVRQCADCHTIIGYTASPSALLCYTCHATSTPGYNNPGPGVPAHTPTYFPTAQCATCHAAANTGHVTWANGKLATHSWFPIASGRHAGIDCMDCHNVDTNLTSYSCAKACHTRQLANHPARSGFSLTTVETQCFVCHKSGSAG